jgi:hypothetical protein
MEDVARFDVDEALTRAKRYAMVASLAVRGLKAHDGMAIDDGYDAIEEIAWEASRAAAAVQEHLAAMAEKRSDAGRRDSLRAL